MFLRLDLPDMERIPPAHPSEKGSPADGTRSLITVPSGGPRREIGIIYQVSTLGLGWDISGHGTGRWCLDEIDIVSVLEIVTKRYVSLRDMVM